MKSSLLSFSINISLCVCLIAGVLGYIPGVVQAQGSTPSTGLSIPCTHGPVIESTGEKECTFLDLIALVKKLITYMIAISVPLAAIGFAWMGVRLLTAQGNPGKITEAWEMGRKIVYGLIFILTGWLIVYTITSAVLRPEFNQFLQLR